MLERRKGSRRPGASRKEFEVKNPSL